MSYAGIRFYRFIKMMFLSVSFILIVSTLLQLDIPNLQRIEANIVSSMIERQLKLQPANEDLIEQGWAYYNIGQYEVAGSLMDRALKREENVSAIYCLALIDLKNKRTQAAVAKLERVQALSPDHTPTLITLGKTYFEKRYFGRSRSFLERAVETDPTNEEARLWLGKTYVNLNDNDQARKILSTVTHGQEAVEAAAILKDIPPAL